MNTSHIRMSITVHSPNGSQLNEIYFIFIISNPVCLFFLVWKWIPLLHKHTRTPRPHQCSCVHHELGCRKRKIAQMDLTHDIKWNEKETTKIWMVFDWSSNYYNGSHFGMANNIDKRIWNQTIITAATTTVK